MTASDSHQIRNEAELDALYGAASPTSLAKETDHLTDQYKAWLLQSPFFALASAGPGGLDCTPRGDKPGEVFEVVDERTLLIPDRRGNNRIDSLRNIVNDPRVGLLFLIPGIEEAMRINGQASLSTHPDWLKRFDIQGILPKCVIEVRIESVYFQCARALRRARLWRDDARASRDDVPKAMALLDAAQQAKGTSLKTESASDYDSAMNTLY